MSLLSKSEIQFLQGKKQVSKSYEYKLKSILKKKLSILLNNDLPLITSLFPDLIELTKFSEIPIPIRISKNLTNSSKKRITLQEQQALRACEGLEGSKNYPEADSQQVKIDIVKQQRISKKGAGRGIS